MAPVAHLPTPADAQAEARPEAERATAARPERCAGRDARAVARAHLRAQLVLAAGRRVEHEAAPVDAHRDRAHADRAARRARREGVGHDDQMGVAWVDEDRKPHHRRAQVSASRSGAQRHAQSEGGAAIGPGERRVARERNAARAVVQADAHRADTRARSAPPRGRRALATGLGVADGREQAWRQRDRESGDVRLAVGPLDPQRQRREDAGRGVVLADAQHRHERGRGGAGARERSGGGGGEHQRDVAHTWQSHPSTGDCAVCAASVMHARLGWAAERARAATSRSGVTPSTSRLVERLPGHRSARRRPLGDEAREEPLERGPEHLVLEVRTRACDLAEQQAGDRRHHELGIAGRVR